MRYIGWTRAGALGLALVVLAGVATAATTSDAVALLVRHQGEVAVERAGGSMNGEVGMQLQPGDRVVVPAGAEAVILYRTGRLLRASATVTIEALAEDGSSSLFNNTVRTLGEVATTDARTQPNRQGMIRPVPGTPVPISPRNEVKVLDVRPTFTWYSGPTAHYIIQIRREGADSPRPVRYDVGSDTTWTLPQSEPALVPGATYMWTVGGAGLGRVADQQRFTVASSGDLAEVEATLAALIEAGIDPATDGLFLAALTYRDRGLMYEADRALSRLAAAGGATGRGFHMLRGEVLDALGDLDAADEAFRRAASADSH